MVKMTNVWERTTGFLGDHAGKVFVISAALIFLPSLVSGSLESAAQPAAPNSAILVVFGLISFLMTIVGVLGGFTITALAIRPSSAGAAIGWAGRRLPLLLGLSILLLLGLIVLALPVLAIVGMSGVDFAAMAVPGATMPAISPGIVFALLGYGIVFTILIVWLGARLALMTPVILAERRGMGTFARAWQLSRGHTWRIIGVLVLYGIVALIATMAIGAAAGVIGYLVVGGATGFGPGTLIVAGAAAVVSTVLSVIQSAFLGKLYVMLAPQAELEETFA